MFSWFIKKNLKICLEGDSGGCHPPPQRTLSIFGMDYNMFGMDYNMNMFPHPDIAIKVCNYSWCEEMHMPLGPSVDPARFESHIKFKCRIGSGWPPLCEYMFCVNPRETDGPCPSREGSSVTMSTNPSAPERHGAVLGQRDPPPPARPPPIVHSTGQGGSQLQPATRNVDLDINNWKYEVTYINIGDTVTLGGLSNSNPIRNAISNNQEHNDLLTEILGHGFQSIDGYFVTSSRVNYFGDDVDRVRRDRFKFNKQGIYPYYLRKDSSKFGVIIVGGSSASPLPLLAAAPPSSPSHSSLHLLRLPQPDPTTTPASLGQGGSQLQPATRNIYLNINTQYEEGININIGDRVTFVGGLSQSNPIKNAISTNEALRDLLTKILNELPTDYSKLVKQNYGYNHFGGGVEIDESGNTFRFKIPGVYPYFLINSPSRIGVIIVEHPNIPL